jgi:adenosyl cobinamide kinase/adenosyl cobinamide phosphate guanylyltransferase
LRGSQAGVALAFVLGAAQVVTYSFDPLGEVVQDVVGTVVKRVARKCMDVEFVCAGVVHVGGVLL